MSEEPNEIKQNILRKYEQTAKKQDKSDTWLEKGGSFRVPEPKGALYFIERKVKMALKMCGETKGLKAMEIGCSTGNMTGLLAKKIDNLTGVDLSPKSVKVAEKRLKHYGINNVKFVADDAEKLSKIKDNEYDIIFSFSCIRYCPNMRAAMQSIYKKVKPGGIVIIDFPNILSPWHFLIKPLLGIKKHIHDNLYSAQELVKLFNDVGFKNVKYNYFLFTTRRIPTFLLPVSKLIDFVFERMFLIKNLAGIIIIRGEKFDKV